MEYFDLFDENNIPLNVKKERSSVHRDGDWHRTAQIWVVNQKKEILCNLRSSCKDLFPNYWDLSIGGHVTSGDTYEDTAIRELWEELGLNVAPTELKFLSDEKVSGEDIKTGLIDREHARLFIYRTNRTIPDFIIQTEEIDKVEYYPIDELVRIVSQTKGNEMPVVPIKKFFLKTLMQIKQELEGE